MRARVITYIVSVNAACARTGHTFTELAAYCILAADLADLPRNIILKHLLLFLQIEEGS